MAKRLQFITLIVSAFVKRHQKYIILGIISGFFTTLLLLQIYPFYHEIIGTNPKKIAYVGEFNETNLPLSIKNQISLGLTSLSSNGEASPSLALSWKADADGKTYIFSLSHDIFWHDGTKFTARDVNYKLKDVTFTPQDETTLKVTLKDSYAPLPVILSTPLFKPNLIGLGIYKAVRIKYSQDNISELHLQPLRKGLPPLIYKFYPTRQAAILAFKLGEVNTLESISQLDDLSNWKNIKIRELTQYDRFVGIFLNFRNPLFKEKEVRQALNYAIPKFEGFEKTYTPISPLSWAYSTNIRLYRYDMEAARKILSKNPISSSSATLTISTYASLLQTAQTVADTWENIGINTKIKVENSIPADYQVFLLTLIIPVDPDQYQYWQSTQEGTNLAHYSNLKIDKLLEDGRKTLDQEKRKKIYADFQRYLIDDSPVIFLYYPKTYTVERE
jgi:peptide/nickel transport system substrate-binding protein